MTVFNTRKLRQASFKGVEFFYQDSTIDGGRKTITHEYPDTNTRYVEDLGKLEKSFSITAMVDNNVNYSSRDALIDVLEQEGVGVLIHPEYGTNNVALKGYSVSNNINNLGVTTFNMTFEVAEQNRFPQTTKGNKGFLANLKSSLFGTNEAAFDAAWESVVNKKQQFDSAVNTTKQASREIQRVSATIEGAVDGLSDYVTTLNQLVDDAAELVQTPSDLSTKLSLMFSNLEVAYNKTEDVFDVASELFGFDQTDRNSSGSSTQQTQIKNNQDQINNFINAGAMATAYNAAANITFTNFDQVNEVNTKLEDGFAALPSNLDKDVYKSLLEMRIQTNEILTNLAISLPRVSTYNTRKVSLNVLTYNLYGSLDKKDDVKMLNDFLDTSRIEGEIKILSNA
jgi:ABC-type transporter Mla subunit MlaD